MPKIPASPPRLVLNENETITTKARALDSILLKDGATLFAPNLEVSTGRVYCSKGTRLHAPKLRSVSEIVVGPGCKIDLPALARIWAVDLRRDAMLHAPELAQVDGPVELVENSTFTAPQLRSVDSLKLWKGAGLIANDLRRVTKGIVLCEAVVAKLNALQSAGHLDLQTGATLIAAKLAECGDLYIAPRVALRATLEEVGTIYLEKDAAFELTDLRRTAGDIGIGEGAALSTPALEVIGGDLTCGPNSRISSTREPMVEGETDLAPSAVWEDGHSNAAKPRVRI